MSVVAKLTKAIALEIRMSELLCYCYVVVGVKNEGPLRLFFCEVREEKGK